MKPIYVPTGAAKEYGDYAINIYTGCPHRCYYCFAPTVLRKDKELFHSCVEPRKNIVTEVARQLEREQITGKLIHLCFTCDPYPTGHDTTPTRDIIRLLKDSGGNHVQILTKGLATRDFDLLDENDWFGITLSSIGEIAEMAEPAAIFPAWRIEQLRDAKELGIKTWVSFEPVLNELEVLDAIKNGRDLFDKVKIGKLNYYPSPIDWASFGRWAEALCKSLGIDYYIKDKLREEMDKEVQSNG